MIDYRKQFSLDGKVAVVTGAARGLGAEIAFALAQAGARVLVTDRLDEGGRETAAAIRQMGGKAEHALHDVTEEGQWEAALGVAVSKLGGLDIVVNNAGIEIPGLLTKCSLEDFRRTQAVNVEGVFLGVKQATRLMAKGGAVGKGGSIINISSVAGFNGVPAHGAYCTSKGAVRLLSKSAAVENARLGTGVRVNSIHPGLIMTDMGSKFLEGYVREGLAANVQEAHDALLAAFPMGHFGAPEDVACGVLYLASDASKWVTGSELVIDGGYVAS